MRRLAVLVLLAAGLSGQEIDSTALVHDTTDASSNEYIHEDWEYFAVRLRNEYLALGEKQYRSKQYQSAVIDYFNFLYHFPEDELVPLVHYRIGRTYERLGEFNLARDQYQLARDDPDADARVQVACMRQLARMDYELGHMGAILTLPDVDDPYILIVKGFASLSLVEWPRSGEYFRRAQKYFPARAQGLLDSLVSAVDHVPDLKYYRTRKRGFFNLLPGGGLYYLGSTGEAAGYAATVSTLALGAFMVDNWTRYVMGAGAAGLYVWSYQAAGRGMARGNERILQEYLAGVHQQYSIRMFWRFGHPAIF